MVYWRELPHCGLAGMDRSGRTRYLAALSVILLLAASVAEAGSHYPKHDKDYDVYPHNNPHPDPGSCPLGSYRSQKTMECEPCPKGTFAVRQNMRSSCAACPSGRTTLREGSLDLKQCVCQPGFGRASGDTETCVRCPQGTYSFGDAFDDCYECPFPKTTSFSGAVSDKDCVCPGGGGSGPDCDQCPQNMILMANGICGCAPGTGGTTCNQCLPGFYSTGGKANNPRPVCKPCGLHFTSPPGAIGPAYCECEAGYGSGDPRDPMSEHTCDVCPVGTYNPGPGLGERHIASVDGYGYGEKKRRLPRASPCRPCSVGNPHGGFTTVDVGAKSVNQCVCAPGYGGPQCDPCHAGTFSPGGVDAVCRSCPGEGAGYTTVPYQAAASASSCVCIPGYGMSDKGLCRICPAGTYSEGVSKEDCYPCDFGHTSAPGSRRKDDCVPASQPCPVGQVAPYGAVSADQCVCLPGHGGTGSKDAACAPCPAGTWSPGVDTQPCINCGFGYTSPVSATSPEECYPINACPAGTQYPTYIKVPTSVEQCVCKAGYGSKTGSAPCQLCPAGSFSEGGTLEDCKPCPFGYKSAPGACGIQECVRTPQACPIGQWAPHDAVSQDQCACYPGFGGGNKDHEPCDICPIGTFSPGFTRDRCIPCGFGYTAPVGSKQERDCYPVDQCPAGTEVPHGEAGSSKQECMCKPGYGSANGEGTCRLCPTASYSPGGTMEDCKPCPFGHTSRPGARRHEECEPIPQACPVGQIALLGAVSPQQCVCLPGHGGGLKPSDPCTTCPPGTWSGGDNTQPCVPCGFGYTSPEAATCPEECYPINACPAGTQYPDTTYGKVPVSIEQCVCKPGFGSSSGKGICSLCPVGTFADGGSMEDCTPCPFGFTSAPGACGLHECRPMVQACPIGQWAPFGAVSAAECRCYKGFGGGDKPTDACSLCPAGTYSANIGTERCIPCGFGFTSPEGACGPEECYPTDQCPSGTEPTIQTLAHGGPQTAQECGCRPGYGAVVGEGACHLCPAGSYSKGGSMEDCVPCPFGYTSAPGTTSWKGCVPAAQECPVGQLAPLGAVSKEECGCLPGHGGGRTPSDACSLCPVGTWSSGGDTNPCIPCDFGYTSPEGATCAEECYPVNACPPGTTMPKYGASSAKECVCLPGYGTESQEGPCSMCPSGYYREGHARGPCLPCPFGMTSPAGAILGECVPMAQPCPVGQIVDPQDEPVSVQDCHCLPGFGGGATPQSACTVCSVGSYSPGIGTQPCFPCPYGFTSPIGSLTPAACYEIETCPGGTTPAMENPSSNAECACIPGFGSPTGLPGDPCFWCPPDTFNEGFNWDGCKSCAEGAWAPSGSPECYPVGTPPKATNRTAPVRRVAPTPAAPAGFIKEWQAPRAVPMAYMSVAQPLFAPAQTFAPAAAQGAAPPMTYSEPQPQAQVLNTARSQQQQQPLQRVARRAGAQQYAAAAPVSAPAASGAYEMQMPIMPMAEYAHAEFAAPYSAPVFEQEEEVILLGNAFSSSSSSSSNGRLGQALSEMQGTSPNPAFSQPSQQQQQQPVVLQQRSFLQQVPAKQQQQQHPMPVQQQPQQQPKQLPAQQAAPLSTPQQQQQQQQQRRQQPMPVQQQLQQQPKQVPAQQAASLPTPQQQQQQQQPMPVQQQPQQQPKQVPAQQAAPLPTQQQQQAAPTTIFKAPVTTPIKGLTLPNMEEKPAVGAPAPAPMPAPVPTAAFQADKPLPAAAPVAAPVPQKLEAQPAPAAASEQKQTVPVAAAPAQTTQPAPTTAAPAQKQPAPVAAAPVLLKQVPVAAAPVQQQPASQPTAAPAAAPAGKPAAIEASTQSTSSSSSSLLARPLAAVRRVVRRYVSAAEPSSNDDLTARAVKVATMGVLDAAELNGGTEFEAETV